MVFNGEVMNFVPSSLIDGIGGDANMGGEFESEVSSFILSTLNDGGADGGIADDAVVVVGVEIEVEVDEVDDPADDVNCRGA